MKFKSQEAYVDLRGLISERTGRVLVWLGAGLSADAGIKGWGQLKSALIEALDNKISSFDKNEQPKLIKQKEIIIREASYWRAFQKLRAALGKTSYKSEIKRHLNIPVDFDVPRGYSHVWRLNISGVLTLNLDGLCARAFSQEFPGKKLIEFNGGQVGNYTHALKAEAKFLVNLHGLVEDESSWVFTIEELNKLQKSEAYVNFVRTCFSAFTIVFIGVSADDIGVGSYLEKLSELGVDSGTHYWITSHTDVRTDRWAEDNGVRLIRYSSDNNHEELFSIFEDLQNFKPKEKTKFDPVVLSASVVSDAGGGGRFIVDQNELRLLSDEDVRFRLNAMVREIKKNESSNFELEYSKFMEKYESEIHRAWFVSVNRPNNKLLGYEIEREVARGAFGRVFKGTDKLGRVVAIKLLLQDIKDNLELLNSFRRGVESMRILQHHGVDGMAYYLNASEIPAFVVMDWIDGPNLSDAVKSKRIREWSGVLKICSQLVKIIKSAHMLPERVLHRDIRPANIMLANFDESSHDCEVKVLDFDLSWHKGSIEKSVWYGSTNFGYLAPEQISAVDGVSTRSALVDSFGIGMTFYFVLAEKDPSPEQQKHNDWEGKLEELARRKPHDFWRCLSFRFARIIKCCTKDKQNERWDLFRVENELNVMIKIDSGSLSEDVLDFLTEELACRVSDGKYLFDVENSSVSFNLYSGVKVVLAANYAASRIDFKFEWTRAGYEKRKHISKWINEKIRTVCEQLNKHGWEVSGKNIHVQDAFDISGHISFQKLNDIARVAENMNKTLEHFRFE